MQLYHLESDNRMHVVTSWVKLAVRPTGQLQLGFGVAVAGPTRDCLRDERDPCRRQCVWKFEKQSLVSFREVRTDCDLAGCTKTRRSTSAVAIVAGIHLLRFS